VATYGLLANPRDVQVQVESLAGFLPPQVKEVVKAEMEQLAGRSSQTLSVEVVVSILAALWAANKGTRALIVALDMSFGQQRPRSLVRLNLISLLLTAGGVAFALLSVAALIAAPALFSAVGLSRSSATLLAWLRWPGLAAALLLGLAVAYRYGPARTPTRWRWVTPGSGLATGLWLVSSAIFSWFMTHHTSYQSFDGSMAAIAVLLTWFLLSAYVVILGAEVDAQLERRRDGRS
jgi:membrane protein